MSQEIHDILTELRSNNGANHKLAVLKKHKDNVLLRQLLKMTYDRVAFTYGITMRSQTVANDEIGARDIGLARSLAGLDEYFGSRQLTGHAAARKLETMLLDADSPETGLLIAQVINRDLRINMGRSQINKVMPGLITKPAYARCDVYSDKTAKKFDVNGAFVQLKADGTYREFYVQDETTVTCVSRQGESYHYPLINAELGSTGEVGYFFGELTVYRDGILLDRATGNGILKKDELPDDCIVIFDCWDFVKPDEYANAVERIRTKTPYEDRWYVVQKVLKEMWYCQPIECNEVSSIQEALRVTAHYMSRGLEGAIIKERGMLFKDGTSKQQLKLKVSIDLEVRVSGFNEGTPGTKREATFGSIIYHTDDGKIKGSVSGFNDTQLVDFNARRDDLIGTVMTVQCNDITKARDKDFHALSHPRFIELRDDKDDTDTFESAMAAKNAALMIDALT